MVPHTSLYWNVIAPICRHVIGKHWGFEVGRKAYMDGRAAYAKLLAEAPDLGEGNPMVHTFQQSMVFVALWQAAEGALTPDDMQLVTKEVLGLKPLAVVGMLKDANRDESVLQGVVDGMRANEAWAQEHEGGYQSAWRVSFDDTKHADGVYYEFTRCPIAEYLHDLGIDEITPVLCDIDHLTTALIHARLLREHTLAGGGPTCDYWIVGDAVADPR